jgi:uncharacterized protein YcfJ
MKAIVASLLVLAASAAQAASFEDFARVVAVQEKYDTKPQKRVVCEPSGQAAPSSGPGVGTLIGAVAGGLLGAQVGRGDGRTAAAAVGAATGALAGNHLENNSANASRNCYETQEYAGRVVGYSVTYEYAGRTFTEHSPTAPTGDTMRVRVNLLPSGAR